MLSEKIIAAREKRKIKMCKSFALRRGKGQGGVEMKDCVHLSLQDLTQQQLTN